MLALCDIFMRHSFIEMVYKRDDFTIVYAIFEYNWCHQGGIASSFGIVFIGFKHF